MKRKRTPGNSLKSSSDSSQQQQLSAARSALHLPDDCWESICTFLV
ncbi:hypothetical protein A2U01_0112585, partial [Trifolium medium]|nr:hypothetical protein [Trifolium medium]